MVRWLRDATLTVAWPCDAAFLVDEESVIVQWRGALHPLSGGDVATLRRELARAGGEERATPDLIWYRLAAALDELAIHRLTIDEREHFDPLGEGPAWRGLVLSCLAPSASAAIDALLDGPQPHVACGFDPGRLAAALHDADRPICLVSGLLAGDLADLAVDGDPRWSRVVWAVHWPEGLYVVAPGSAAGASLRLAAARAEANQDLLVAGMKLLRAASSGVMVPASLPAPTPAQVTALLAIAARPAGRHATAWRITAAGRVRRLDPLSIEIADPAIDDRPPVDRSTAPTPDALLDRRLGPIVAVSEFGRFDSAGGPLHVWRARFGNPRHALGRDDDFDPCMDAFGTDAEPGLARLKAMMEALERHAGMRWPVEESLRCRRGELTGVVEPDELPGYLPEQYAAPGFAHVPFAASAERIWLPARCLTSGRPLWVLSDFALWPPVDGPSVVQATSSGTAAHLSWEQACSAALLELIERDSLVLAWLTRAAGPRIPIAALPEPAPSWCEAIVARGYRVHLRDVTSDVGVPVALVLAEATRPGLPHVLVNGGAAADLPSAAEKGIRELVMMLLFQARIGNDLVEPATRYRRPPDHARLYFDATTRGRWEFLLANHSVTRRLAAPRVPSVDFSSLARRLAGSGVVAAIDRTPPAAAAAGLHVVTVVAAGLQPLHFGPDRRRLRSRRLREHVFPDALCVDGPLDAHGLNPYPHPYC